MNDNNVSSTSGLSDTEKPAIRFLVERALRSVMERSSDQTPQGRGEWLLRLCDALVSDSEATFQTVIAQLMACGVSSEEILHSYVPDAARLLGELWVEDKASFVDVTVAASRLQSLYRSQADAARYNSINRAIPLGKSVLMVVPEHEQHSLGAFVAADEMRRKGVWVHMGIALTAEELADLLTATRFSMVGLSVGSHKAIENTTNIVDYLRAKVADLPPIVIGGVAAENSKFVEEVTGADYAVRTVQDAMEVCGLAEPRQAMHEQTG
jgi:methanogenic corrinoid protein MtbC1